MKTFCFVVVNTSYFLGMFMLSLINTKRNQKAYKPLRDFAKNFFTGIGNFSMCSREFAMLNRHVILLMLEFTLTNTSTLSVEEVSKF